jgi:hypothetical protein
VWLEVLGQFKNTDVILNLAHDIPACVTVFQPTSLIRPPFIEQRVQISDNVSKFTETHDPCGGGLEYLHRCPPSRKKRDKGNPVPGGITGPPCSWGI